MADPYGNGQWLSATIFAPVLLPGEVITGARWDITGVALTFSDTQINVPNPPPPSPPGLSMQTWIVLFQTNMRNNGVARL